MITEIVVAGILITVANRLYLKNQAKIKGYSGEVKLARAMKRLKLPGKVNVLRDCLFPLEQGGTSQVDVIAVTRYGVFILENKNYNCDVYGSVHDNEWDFKYPAHKPNNDPLQYLEKKSYHTEKKDYNPIKQNKTHITAVSAILREKYPRIPYFPLVVFSDKANLHVQKSHNRVCNLRQLGKVVPRLIGKQFLTDKQVSEITNLLQQNRLKGRRAKQNHITNINLGKEVREEGLNKKEDQIKEEFLRQAEDKPVLSAEGELPFQGKQNPRTYADNMPLSEIIYGAKARSSKQDMPSQNRPFSR